MFATLMRRSRRSSRRLTSQVPPPQIRIGRGAGCPDCFWRMSFLRRASVSATLRSKSLRTTATWRWRDSSERTLPSQKGAHVVTAPSAKTNVQQKSWLKKKNKHVFGIPVLLQKLKDDRWNIRIETSLGSRLSSHIRGTKKIGFKFETPSSKQLKKVKSVSKASA